MFSAPKNCQTDDNYSELKYVKNKILLTDCEIFGLRCHQVNRLNTFSVAIAVC